MSGCTTVKSVQGNDNSVDFEDDDAPFQSDRTFGKKFCESNNKEFVNTAHYLGISGFTVFCFDFKESKSTEYIFSSKYKLMETIE